MGEASSRAYPASKSPHIVLNGVGAATAHLLDRLCHILDARAATWQPESINSFARSIALRTDIVEAVSKQPPLLGVAVQIRALLHKARPAQCLPLLWRETCDVDFSILPNYDYSLK